MGATEDGYATGAGPRDCPLHSLDYLDNEWSISLSELLRLIQLFNLPGFSVGVGGEDGIAALPPEERALWDLLVEFRATDDNADFRLTLEEAQSLLPNLTETRFNQIDVDGDGTLSRFEIYAETQASDDIEPPVITLEGPASVTLQCGEAFVEPGYSATDNVDGDITDRVRPAANQVSIHQGGAQTIVYVVFDSAWNVGTATREVVVADTEAPVAVSDNLGIINLECGDIFRDPGVLVVDNCDRDRRAYADDSSYDAGTPGEYVLNYPVVDGAGNIGTTVSRILRVRDTDRPRLIVLGDDPVLLDLNDTYLDPGVEAVDECDPDVSVDIDTSELDTSTEGLYTVRYTATDASGNDRMASRRVRVYDGDNIGLLTIDAEDCDYYFDANPSPIFGNVYDDGAAYALGSTVTITWPNWVWLDAATLNGENILADIEGMQYEVTIGEGLTELYFHSTDCFFLEGEGEYEGEGSFSFEGSADGESAEEGEPTPEEGEAETSPEGEGEGGGEAELPDIFENPFVRVSRQPLSTFSVDVDTGSYSLARRYLTQGQFPPPEDIRIEELLNYFSYDYRLPRGRQPFSVTTEVAGCPWTSGNRLMLIGLQAYDLSPRPASAGQPRVPARCIRFHGRLGPAAPRQRSDVATRHRFARAGGLRQRRDLRAHRAETPAAHSVYPTKPGRDTRAHRQPLRRRQHQRRPGVAIRLRSRRRAIQRSRYQPNHPVFRWRL